MAQVIGSVPRGRQGHVYHNLPIANNMAANDAGIQGNNNYYMTGLEYRRELNWFLTSRYHYQRDRVKIVWSL